MLTKLATLLLSLPRILDGVELLVKTARQIEAQRREAEKNRTADRIIDDLAAAKRVRDDETSGRT